MPLLALRAGASISIRGASVFGLGATAREAHLAAVVPAAHDPFALLGW